MLSQYDNGFYQTEQFGYILAKIRTKLNHEIGAIYSTEVYSFIRDLDSIVLPQRDAVAFHQNKHYSAVNHPNNQNNNLYTSHKNNNNLQLPNNIVNPTKMQPPVFGMVSFNQQSVRLEWA